MSDGLMDETAIGKFLAGKSARTGRRFLKEWPGQVFTIRGHRYIRQSDLEEWVNAQSIERTPRRQPTSIKSMLDQISDQVLAKRKAAQSG
jgi:hypothetical protein